MSQFESLKDAVRRGDREDAEEIAQSIYESSEFDSIQSDGERAVWVYFGGLCVGIDARYNGKRYRVATTGSASYETPDGNLLEDLEITVRSNPKTYRAVTEEVTSW